MGINRMIQAEIYENIDINTCFDNISNFCTPINFKIFPLIGRQFWGLERVR